MKYFLILLILLLLSCTEKESFYEEKLSFEIKNSDNFPDFMEKDSRYQIKSMEIYNGNEQSIYILCPDTLFMTLTVNCLDKRLKFWHSQPGKFRSFKTGIIELSKKTRISLYTLFPKEENLHLCDAFRFLFIYSTDNNYKQYVDKPYSYQRDTLMKRTEVIFSKNMEYKKIRPFTTDVINEEDMNLK